MKTRRGKNLVKGTWLVLELELGPTSYLLGQCSSLVTFEVCQVEKGEGTWIALDALIISLSCVVRKSKSPL